MATYKLVTPLLKEDVEKLKSGDKVLISGTIYAARDAAHAKLIGMLKNNEHLPFEINGAVIYYVGPTPEKPGEIIGSAGPTTSYRMDAYAPKLIELGLKGMIGKGKRNEEVTGACMKYSAAYFGATGGAGALISEKIKKNKIIAFPELGAEALRELYVEEMPLIVVNDCYGNDLYEEGTKKWMHQNQ